MLNLFSHYLTLLFKQAAGLALSRTGPLEILSIVLGAGSIFLAVKAIFIEP